MGLELSTPALDFDNDTIDKNLQDDRIGNYALGYIKDGSFYVRYVGRTDSCLKSRLKDHEHMKDKNCTKFKYKYALNATEAFNKECKNYHDFSPPLNKSHPDSPDALDLDCIADGCEHS